jgi:PAS domain-containing protein
MVDGMIAMSEPPPNYFMQTSQSEFAKYFAELTRKIDALEAHFAASEVSEDLSDLKQKIRVLYEAMRERDRLLTTVLENSAASIYAKRKDGRYTYLNREMEALCNVVRERVLGKTDFEVFPKEIAQQWRSNDLQAMATGELTVVEETIDSPRGKPASPLQEGAVDFP